MTRLAVPYLSQLDAQGNGGANCGPAGLAEMLTYRGVFASTPGTVKFVADIVRDGLFDGIGETGGYTSFAMLFRACAWFSVDAVWIDSWQGVSESLAAGEPVLLLCDNTQLLPRQYPRNADFNGNHFILLCSEDAAAGAAGDDGAPASADVNDPLRTYPPIGPGTYTWDSLFRAVAPFGGVEAMALAPIVAFPSNPEEANVPNQDGIISELNGQVADLHAEVTARTEERDEARAKVDELVSTNSALRDQREALALEVAGLKTAAASVAGAVATTARVLVTITTPDGRDQSWALPPD